MTGDDASGNPDQQPKQNEARPLSAWQEARGEWIRRWRDPITLFTLLLVIVGGVQWCTLHDTDTSIRGQLNVMQRQLDAMERDQIPYVYVTDHIEPPVFDISKGRISWNWPYANLGKGRAVDMTADSFMRLGKEKFRHSPTVTGPGYGGDLPTGKENFATTASAPIGQEEAVNLLQTDDGVSLLLEFRYSDITGKTFQTDICFAHLKNRVLRILNPKECEKQKQE